MHTWHDYVKYAEKEVYRGKTAKGLRRMATNMKASNKEKATAYYYIAARVAMAPKHGNKLIYGGCPPWPHE